jgi:hypothetical protein
LVPKVIVAILLMVVGLLVLRPERTKPVELDPLYLLQEEGAGGPEPRRLVSLGCRHKGAGLHQGVMMIVGQRDQSVVSSSHDDCSLSGLRTG